MLVCNIRVLFSLPQIPQFLRLFHSFPSSLFNVSTVLSLFHIQQPPGFNLFYYPSNISISLVPLFPAPGCSQCHRGITIGDWRDPLDPDLDAQIILSQFMQGKSGLIKKYLPLPLDDECSNSLRGGSNSPTSMTSSGATSLQDHDGGGGGASNTVNSPGIQSYTNMEDCCRDLLEVVDELSWHHSQIRH